MYTLAASSTTAVSSWTGADLSAIGPIYPFVGTEFALWIVGLIFWIGFHVLQVGIEKKEMADDEKAAQEPDRLKRVFEHEADTGI